MVGLSCCVALEQGTTASTTPPFAEGRRPKYRPFEEGDDSDPGLATQRERGLTASAPRVCRPADYLPSGTVGQWPPVTGQWWNKQKGGDPRTDQAKKVDDSDPGLASRRESDITATKRGTLEPAWVRGPKDPSA